MNAFTADTTDGVRCGTTRVLSAAMTVERGAVMARLDTLWRDASADAATRAEAASVALAWLIADWGTFRGWRTWCTRREQCAGLAAAPQGTGRDADAVLMAVGGLAAALLRGGEADEQRRFGSALEERLESVNDAPRLLLAMATLLPWYQMSRNPVAAHALHRRVTDTLSGQAVTGPAERYLRDAGAAAWVLHLHFSGESETAGSELSALEQDGAGRPHDTVFRLARIGAELALARGDFTQAEACMARMLAAVAADRPLEQVITNHVASALACAHGDGERAARHVEHNERLLEVAECPPAIAGVYRLSAARAHLLSGDHDAAARAFAQCADHAHAVHARTYGGYAALCRALAGRAHGGIDAPAWRDDLHAGLEALRDNRLPGFWSTIPKARGAICAMALSHDVATEFVLEALRFSPVPPPLWADEHWPWALSFRLFGGFRLLAGAADLANGIDASRRPVQLLQIIAAHGRDGVPIGRVLDALWPEQDGAQAENALGVTLLRLRRMCGDASLIERSAGWLKLDEHRVWTDVRAFEATLDESSRAAPGSPRRAAIRRALALHGGELMLGCDESWALERARHYRGMLMTATRQWLIEAIADGDSELVTSIVAGAQRSGLPIASIVAALPEGRLGGDVLAELRQHVALLADPA